MKNIRNIFVAVVCGWMPFSLPTSAAIYKCTNDAGKVEFKDKPCASETEQSDIKKNSPNISSGSGSLKMTLGKDDNLVRESIEYMDRLKTCTSHTHVIEMPMFGTVRNEIIGKKNGRCHIVNTYTESGTKMVCNYTDETIALLTSEEKYNQVRNGQFFGSSDSPEAARMNAECIAEF